MPRRKRSSTDWTNVTESDLLIQAGVSVPRTELVFSAVRAAGPGGQHVNKTSTAIELRFDAAASRAFDAEQRRQIMAYSDQRIGRSGVIVIKSREHRSQVKNRRTAEERLRQLLRAALAPATPRIPTRPTRAQRQKRLEDKAHRAKTKARRRPIDD